MTEDSIYWQKTFQGINFYYWLLDAALRDNPTLTKKSSFKIKSQVPEHRMFLSMRRKKIDRQLNKCTFDLSSFENTSLRLKCESRRERERAKCYR